jgi:RHS repeat-associated protein
MYFSLVLNNLTWSYRLATETIGNNDIISSLMSVLGGSSTYAGVPINELSENARTIKLILEAPNLAEKLSTIVPSNYNAVVPKAHITHLFFDDQMQLVPDLSGSFQVPASNGGNWQAVDPGSVCNCTLAGPGTSGWVVIYVDNQSIGKDVWFDNIHIEHYTSEVLEEDHYYPFGLTVKVNQSGQGNLPNQPYKYQGIELEKHFGLEMYETFYRGLDPQLGRFMQVDPKAEGIYHISPYASMDNNPASKMDPSGLSASTDVRENRNGTNTVTGGQLNADRNIYVVDGNNKKTGEVIGKSLTQYSFFGDNDQAVIGAVINPADNAGRNFMNNRIVGSDIGVLDYSDNAKGGELLDFKTNGIDGRAAGMSREQFMYRGVPFEGVSDFGNQDGKTTTFASARDVGNVAAGYVMGKNGLTWGEARLGFDALQTYQQGKISTEGYPTISAETLGFKTGYRVWADKHPFQNLFRSSDLKSAPPK